MGTVPRRQLLVHKHHSATLCQGLMYVRRLLLTELTWREAAFFCTMRKQQKTGCAHATTGMSNFIVPASLVCNAVQCSLQRWLKKKN